MPTGLEDVSKYPDLFDELMKEEPAWTEEELRNLAGANLIRVWKEVERIRDSEEMQKLQPYQLVISDEDLLSAGQLTECRSNYKEPEAPETKSGDLIDY